MCVSVCEYVLVCVFECVYLRCVELVLEQLLLLRGDLVDETLDVFALLLGALALLLAAAARSVR